MPTLDKHQSNEFVKLLLLGDTKSGKTGSLVSLVKARYKLRIIDMDNLLDSLKYQVMQQCPELAGNVEYRTLRDKRVMTVAGPIIQGIPRAFTDAIKLMDRWKYDDVDLGVPADWGPDCILVLDSLSRFCDACYDWQLPLTPKGKSGDIDTRATYFNSQGAVEDTLATLTSDSFESNVIVICHGVYMDQPDGTTKIFPQGVGQKLSPKIPQYFPSYVRYKNVGGKRTIQLVSDAMIDLANPNPAKLSKSLSIETGLAEFFEALREQPKEVPDEPRDGPSTTVVQPIGRQVSQPSQDVVRRVNRPLRRT